MSLSIDYGGYFGVPFRRGGRGPDELDCHGLLIQLHADQGIQIIDFASPASNEEAASLFLGHKSAWRTKWEKSAPGQVPPHTIYQPGDTLLFSIRGTPCHVGMVITSLRFVHTWEGTKGVVAERMSLWERKVHGIYRHHQLPD